RAAIADMFQAADLLRPMDVAQGNVVGRREGAGREGFQRADVDLAHRFAGAGADGGQVPAGDDRKPAAQLVAARLGTDEELLVVIVDRGLQRLLLVLRTLPGLAAQQIARSQEGYGA